MSKNLPTQIGKSLPKKVGQAAGKVATAVNPLEAIDNILGHVSKWHEVTENNKTQRQAIAAQRDVMLEQIRSERDVLMYNLQSQYQERAKTYDKYFEVIDKALESGNIEMLQMGLNSVVDQIKHNPLPSKNELKNALQNNTPIDF